MITPRSHRSSLVPAQIFVVVLVSLVGATALARAVVPGLAARVSHITMTDPSGDDAYLAHDRGGHLDHHVHYFGLEPSAVEALRRAEVVFLGNSRLMFALRPQVLDPFFESRGLDYYAMGFGFREGDRFPLEILRRFNIRPRVVVVNADGFFGRDLSAWAEEVVKDTRFGAMKLRWENERTHEIRRVVHQVLPHWLDLFARPGLDEGEEFIAYRSRRNGTWSVSPWPDGGTAVPPGLPGGNALPWTIDAARKFKSEIEERGSRLVLTFVPTPDPETREVIDVAEALQVPLAVPHVEGLTSHDQSHLTEDSAVIWAERFVQVLSTLLPSN